MYSEKIIEHFMSPQNAWYMPDADEVGKIGEPGCGDNCMIFIKVRDGIIQDISLLRSCRCFRQHDNRPS